VRPAPPVATAAPATARVAGSRVFDFAWALFAFSSAVYFLCDNEADNDLWVHLLTGLRILRSGSIPRVDDLSYTATGSPWVDHEWLTQTLFAQIFEAVGPTGLWLLKVGAAAATAYLLWRMIARRSQVAWARGLAMVLVLAIVSRGFSMRPQIATYLGTAWLLDWIDAGDASQLTGASWRRIAALALVFALWANLHGGFVFGIGVLALFAALPPFASAAWRWGALAAALAAACLNPFGPRLFAYVASELQIGHPLTEWQPTALLAPEHRPLLLALIALAVTLPLARALRRPWHGALLAATTAMALGQQRHTPLVALCAAAPLAEQIEAAQNWIGARWPGRPSRAALGLLTSALLFFSVLQIGFVLRRLAADRFRPVYEAADYPVGAMRFLAERDLGGNLALPLDWGGYALWHGGGKLKVSLDGRFATVYPAAVVDENFAFFRDDPAGAALLDRHPTTLVVAPRGAATPAHRRPEWRVLYRDEVAEVLGAKDAGEPAEGHAPSGRLPFP
jgi:hypothetical protein